MDAKPKDQEAKAFNVTICGQSFGCNPMPPQDGMQWVANNGEPKPAEIAPDDQSQQQPEE